MKQRPRAFAFSALLGVTLLFSGCAAGSPAVVAPTAPQETTLQAPSAAGTAPDVTDADPDVAAVAEPPTGASEPVQAANAAAGGPAEPEAPEIANHSSAPAPSTSDSVGFSQTVPALGGQQPDEASDPTISEPDGSDAAPAAQAARPPAPPDPGTGLSTIVEGGTNGRLEVALTFDAGADTGYGSQILDYLRDEGISASFGMTGLWAEANPELVQRMVAEGHQLINHTWDHQSLTGANTGMPAQTPEQVAMQLADTEAIVRDLTGGYEMRPYFRPPYGDYDEATLGHLYDNGYYLSIWWTCDSHGWAGWGVQEIIDYCTTNIAEDEILLMHVGADAVSDFEALPGLVQFFRDSGYTFVTVEQMLQP